MRTYRLLTLSFVSSVAFGSLALAQQVPPPPTQPSIEINKDVLQGLMGQPAAAGGDAETNVKTTTSTDGTLPASPPAVKAEDSRGTLITPPPAGEVRWVWVKGPDGQQVVLKPDPKPRKKKIKKPAPVSDAAAGSDKICTCPEGAKSEPAKPANDPKAAPVEPVKVEEKAPPAPPPPPPPPPPPAAPANAPATPPAPPPPPPPPPPAGTAAPAGQQAPVAAPPPPPAAPVPPPPPAAAPPAPPAAAPAAPVAAPPAPTSANPPAAPVVLSNPPAPAGVPAAAAAPVDPKAPPAVTMVFKPTETAMPLTVKESMDKLVAELKANESQRVNMVAYASAAADQASTARRVSLARALSVRAYLIDNGINTMRINVQAEGDKNPGGEPDRVDIFVAK